MTVIARVYQSNRPQRVITTRPGHSVQIRGGAGNVFDARDMVSLLRHPELVIEVEPDQADWLHGWAQDCGERTPAQAEVHIAGRFVGPAPKYAYRKSKKTESSEVVGGSTAPPPTDPADTTLTADDLLAGLLPPGGWGDGEQNSPPAGS